jgi:hypothetical protein
MACRPQSALISYFVRVDEDVAHSLLERALAARSGTGCYRAVLADVRPSGSPVVSAVAVEHLNDKEPSVVRNAIEALGQAPTAAVRELLFEVFRKWHSVWQGREDELEGLIERALFAALSRGPRTESELRELEALCVTEMCRIEARIRLSSR